MKQAFVFITRGIENANMAAVVKKIDEQVSPFASFFIMSYREDLSLSKYELPYKDRICIINRKLLASHSHHYKNKYHGGSDWKLIPGNVDLAHMTFAKLHTEFDYFWFCEDDVRYTGDLGEFISNHDSVSAEMLCTNLRPVPDKWFYKTTYDDDIGAETVMICLLCFYRMSKHAFEIIDAAYEQSIGGHQEISMVNILTANGKEVLDFNTVSDTKAYTSNLNRLSMNGGTFCYFPPKLFALRGKNLLYHPIKPLKPYLKLYWKHFKQKIYQVARL